LKFSEKVALTWATMRCSSGSQRDCRRADRRTGRQGRQGGQQSRTLWAAKITIFNHNQSIQSNKNLMRNQD
jgi:hypothetical protein